MNFDSSTVFGALLLLLILVIAGITFYLLNKIEEIKQIKTSHNKLMRSFNDLDEQARLIRLIESNATFDGKRWPLNRVGGGLAASSSHTTGRAGRHPAVHVKL